MLDLNPVLDCWLLNADGDCLFDAAIKATTVDGKAFSDKNNFDTTTHYGKTIFAHKVVRPNAASVNFDGFRPLLDNLVLAIRAHAAKVQAAPASPPHP
jgi:RNA-directed DNA polymerase